MNVNILILQIFLHSQANSPHHNFQKVKGKIYLENERAIRRSKHFKEADIADINLNDSDYFDDGSLNKSAGSLKRKSKKRRRWDSSDDDEFENTLQSIDRKISDLGNDPEFPPDVSNACNRAFGPSIVSANDDLNAKLGQILSAVHTINSSLSEQKEQINLLKIRMDSISEAGTTSTCDHNHNNTSGLTNRASRGSVIDINANPNLQEEAFEETDLSNDIDLPPLDVMDDDDILDID